MKIIYFAWLKNITGKDQEIIKNVNLKDVKSLKKFIIKKYPKLKIHFEEKNLIRVAINLKYTNINIKLNQNDEIAFFPQVSGG
ncbi:MAG: hypothetical protein CFH19_00299 [Alphaproteobacteria bacterium MarineAlpha5_Bin9]|nr:MAG: hypothetical protein CFH19_00299 [Alphaproteobacteria bacterium MarineAlpha5_Bin9]|tara:strand:+ start:4072 stop:4320 length:249 start_codon:yes stop_codon:yes gene_type:complete